MMTLKDPLCAWLPYMMVRHVGGLDHDRTASTACSASGLEAHAPAMLLRRSSMLATMAAQQDKQHSSWL